MARKLILFVLLVVVWAALYLLLSGGESASFPYLFFPPAHPSNRPLPAAWAAQPARVQLLSQADLATLQASPVLEVGGPCGHEYQVQRGDTLISIASRCQIRVEEIQSRNPGLANPNRIYPGQQLVLYTPQGKTETAPRIGGPLQNRFRPGAVLVVQVSGLPVRARVRVGMGFATSGYRLLLESQADEAGNLSIELGLPGSVVPGDQGFVLVTTQEIPTVQAMSETFEIIP
jgi:hypothetical protein